MEDLKLVICDIDSTLINNKRELTPRTKADIEKLHAKGYYFGLASGRPLDELDKYAPNWGLSFECDVLIGMNGSEIWDGIHKEEHSYFKLKKEWMKEIIEMMHQFDSNCFLYRDGYILAQKMNKMMEKTAGTSNKEIVLAKDDSDFYCEENAKLMFRVSEETMPILEQYAQEHPSPNYSAFKTQTTLFEFADKRVNKGWGLQKLCEMIDMPLECVAAFGDTSNDNEMLKVAGLGVCMLNGSDDTKACADEITEYSNDEDGLAIYLEKKFPEIFEN